MKTYRLLTIEIDTGRVVEEISTTYSGPVALCKGESKKAAEEARKQRELENRLTMEAIAKQDAIRAQLQGALGQYLSPEGQGYDEKTMAALNALAVERVPELFGDVESQLYRNLAQRGAAGGSMPVSGAFLRNLAQLRTGEAKTRVGLQRDVQIQNAIQALQNRFNTANIFAGYASNFTPSPFVGGASSALSSQVKAAETADKPGFFGQLAGAFAGGLGGSFGSGLGDWIWGKDKP